MIYFRRVENFIYFWLKLILFYLWNVLKLIGVKEEEIINNFKIEDDFCYELIHEDYILNISEENKIKVGRIIKNIDFYKYSEFYEQLYLYGYVWEYYYNSNKGINYNKYEHIDKSVNTFKNFSLFFDIKKRSRLGFIRAGVGSKNDKYVYMDLMEIRCILINEWREHSKDLSLENFYEKNYEVLREINIYAMSMH